MPLKPADYGDRMEQLGAGGFNVRPKTGNKAYDDRVQALLAAGVDPDEIGNYLPDEYKYLYDRPEEIQYQAAYDPKTMSLLPELDQKLAGIQMDKRGLNKFRDEALRSGESAWAGLAKRSASMDAMANREMLLRGAQGRAAEARSGMARRGGIGSGSQERLGRMAMREGLLAQQGSYRDLGKAKLGISMQDEQNRIGQLGQLPGMEVQALQPEFEKTGLWAKGKQFDIGNSLQEAQNKNKFAMDMWQKKMEQWGAGQTAAAQVEAGDGSWLCTESAKRGKLTDSDRKALGRLLRYGMQTAKKRTSFYVKNCHPLVAAMQANGYDWGKNDAFVRAVITMVDAGQLPQALEFYTAHTLDLLARHWPEGYHTVRKLKEAA